MALELPVKPTPDMALAIIDQLDEKAFYKVAEGVRLMARRKAYDAMEEMRTAARRGGLKKSDFQQAMKEVRGRKKKR
jgi:hypothetical protein